MKRKIMCLVLTFVVILSIVPMFEVVAEQNPISVVLDGNRLWFDVPPQIISGRTMVPLRVIFESLGATVEWDDVTKTVTSSKDNTTIIMTIGQAIINVNGEDKILDVAPAIIDNRTLVPVRAVAEGFNAKVEWDDDVKTVLIDTKEALSDNVTIYSPNGAKKSVRSSLVSVYKEKGWYDFPVVTLYSLDASTIVVGEGEVSAYKAVGWYEYPVTTLYALDGRTMIVNSSQVEAYKAVGWYTYPVYVADGSLSKPFTALNTNSINYLPNWYGSKSKKIIFNVTGYARGDKAEAIGGLENAEADQEWILLKVKITYLAGEDEMSFLNVEDYLYNKSGSKYNVYDDEDHFGYSEHKKGDIYNKGIYNCSTFAGGSMEGYVAVLTDKDAEMPIIKIPIKNGNMFVSTVGAPELTKKTKEETIAENPVLSKCKLEIPAVPTTLQNAKTTYTNGAYRDILQSKFIVTGITYEFKESSGGKVDLYIYYMGEKLYDVNGSGQTSDCKIGWKLYDAEGYVLKDGTTYTMGIAMNEKFKDVEQKVYSLDPGAYKLVIMGVNGY